MTAPSSELQLVNVLIVCHRLQPILENHKESIKIKEVKILKPILYVFAFLRYDTNNYIECYERKYYLHDDNENY